MRNNLLLLVLFLFTIQFTVSAQEAGDTIKVQLYTYDNPDRSIDATLPSADMEFEKIILKYNMRCKNALVSTGQDRNKGCGEWDYSCNTYVIDSSKVEAVESSVKSHFITDFSGDTYEYSNTPTRNYLQVEEVETELNLNSGTEKSATVGTSDSDISSTFQTEEAGSKSMYLISAADLSELDAGDIHGMRLSIGNEASDLDFLRIRIAATDREELIDNPQFDNFQEVYFQSTDLDASGVQDFNFSEPFAWDGSSNIVIETSFDNRIEPSASKTSIKGYNAASSKGMIASPQREILLYNNAYIETDAYKGVQGSQNRTMEAWIKTDQVSNGELVSWGSDIRGEKWVWRLNGNGQLRLEINGGGTEGTTNLVDGKWHHVVCVLDGNNLNNISFYVDGVKETLSSVGNLSINTTDAHPVRISKGVNNRYHHGHIDEVRIWNVALSGDEIRNWMRMNISENHPQYENLLLEYKFDEVHGNVILDNSGNGNHARYVGSPIRSSFDNGTELFKEFDATTMLPMMELFQGDFTVSNSSTTSLKEIDKASNYVISRSINPGNPDLPISDEIVETEPVLYYRTIGNIYNQDGDIVDTEENDLDGTINITDLSYNRRWPMYTELLSFVTPYGINLDLGEDGATWYFDMTDFSPVLRGDKHFLMALGGQNQEEMDVELWYIVGTPPRDIMAFDQVWQATVRTGSARINSILDGTKFPEAQVEVPAEAKYFNVRSTITGHGAQGEFSQNGGQVTHFLETNEEYYDWTVTQECSFNPIYPQGGTWIFDRQGWCPGEVSHTEIIDVTDFRDGNTFTFNYTTSSPAQSDGDYRYHVSHQLISYGDYNFSNDGRLNAIVAPSDLSLYQRRNPICEDPVVLFENTGGTPVTSITIDYWVNNGGKISYTWNGDEIMPSEEREITLPNNSIYKAIDGENNIFHAEITSINGASDEYVHNNRMSSIFEAPKEFPNEFYIEIRTNLAAHETSYKLYDVADNVVGSNTLEESNTLYRDTFNIKGCYRLEIIDTGHDGLNFFANNDGAGSATIYGMRRQILQHFNPDFGGGITYHFTTPGSTSTIENDLNNITLYPNPATDKIIVAGSELKKYDIDIIDSYGKVIKLNYSISDSQLTADVSSLVPGLYFIQFSGENGVKAKKFIVQ